MGVPIFRRRISRLVLPDGVVIGIILAVIFGLKLFDVNSVYSQSIPLQLKGHGGPIKAITLSADGKKALTASFDYSIIYWNLDGAEAKIIHRMIGHDNAVNDVEFVAGRELAVSVSDDGSLGIWRLSDGKLIKRIASGGEKILDVAVSEDGKYAAASRWDRTIGLYELTGYREVANLRGHRGNVNSSVFSRDGKALFSAGNDGKIIEWDVAARQIVRPVYDHGWGINSLGLLDDGNLVFGAIDGTIGVVDPRVDNSFATLVRRERPIQAVKISRDGKYFAAGGGDGAVQIFDGETRALIRNEIVTFGPVWDFDFVPNTTQIFHVGLDDFAMRWQITPQISHVIDSKYPRRFQLTTSLKPGELEFQRKCSICHTLERDGKNRAGPTLHGLFGREAGTLAGYQFSEALLKSTIIWNEASLARLFDDGPDVVTPGTKMPIQRLKSVERRDALIAYLKKATATKIQEKTQ